MRNQTTVLSLCGCAAVCFLAAGCRSEDPASTEPQKDQVIIDEQSVTINGVALTLPTTRPELVKILGQPSRVLKPGTTIVTWDELGLYATEHFRTGEIEAFTIALDKEDYDYWPKKLFRGKLSVDGSDVTARSTAEEINRNKKGAAFTRDEIVTIHWGIKRGQQSLILVEADPKERSAKANFSHLQIGVVGK